LAHSLALDERALILAPPPLAADTSRLLASAGIDSLCAVDLANLHSCLAEGAGLAIIAEQVFSQGPSALLQAFLDQQQSWSDLPIVLLIQGAWSATGASNHPVGNLLLMVAPFDNAQLLHMTQSALRNRRRQYLTRDQLQDLQQRLNTPVASSDPEQERNEFAHYQARKMEAIGQLAGGVAHDFNNLLTSIGGSFELIERRLHQGRCDGLDSVLRMGREAVARAARLTHRLLAFSSRQSLHSQRVDLHSLLEVKRLKACLNPAVTLHVHIAKGLWPVEADNKQLQDALDNLLLNASEAMPNGGQLRIEASNQHIENTQFTSGALCAGDYLRLSIIDDGQGMARSTMEHAFEPFFQYQGDRPGHRPGPVDGVWLQQAVPRACHAAQPDRPRHPGRPVPAAPYRPSPGTEQADTCARSPRPSCASRRGRPPCPSIVVSGAARERLPLPQRVQRHPRP